jgi:hypothetical protein
MFNGVPIKKEVGHGKFYKGDEDSLYCFPAPTGGGYPMALRLGSYSTWLVRNPLCNIRTTVPSQVLE